MLMTGPAALLDPQVVEIFEEADRAVERAADVKTKRRAQVWRLRLEGYSLVEVAEQLGITFSMAQRDYTWCTENFGVARDGGDDLLRLSLSRLEFMIRQLASKRAEGDEHAFKTTAMLIDMQAKLLGLYKIRVEQTSIHVNFNLNGVDPRTLL